MVSDGVRDQLREAGITAWKATVLTVVTVLLLVLYVGMVVLVFRGYMDDGPLLLFTGVLLGYLLHAIRGYI